MRYRHLFIISIVFAIGCSSTPFDASNINDKIATDLQIPANSISLSSRCNFNQFQYGPQLQPATMEDCVFIKTQDAFEFLGYDKKRQVYMSKYRIPFTAMQCAMYGSEGIGKGMLHLYTDEYTFTLALFQPDSNRLDHRAVDEVLTALRTNNIRIIDIDTGTRTDPFYLDRRNVRHVVRNRCLW
jgi:hypothetical protein